MCEHGETGAMGFIVNKPTEFSVHEIFEQLGLDTADALDREVSVMTGGRSSHSVAFCSQTTRSPTTWLKSLMDYT